MTDVIRIIAIAALAVVTSGPGAHAQVYPSRPITMNVPYAAGGPLDVMVRVVADGLRAALGQAIFADMVMAVADSAELQFELVILRCPATFDLDVRHAISLTTLLEAVLQSFQAADLASSHGFFT